MGTALRWRAAIVVIAIAFGSIEKPAHAAVVLEGNHPQPDENVLFNESGLADSGLFVEGITNNTDAIVRFTSDEYLETPSSGAARIEAVAGGFDSLQVEIPGSVFKSLILNLHASGDGQVTFTTAELGSPLSYFSFDLGNGGNFFTLTSAVGFNYISLLTDVDVEVDDARQFRIGGIAATPEPASLVIWSLIAVSASVLGMRHCRRGG